MSFMRHRKGSNHFSRAEPELVCQSVYQPIPTEEGSKRYHEAPPIVAFEKTKRNINTVSEDDEDVCPICLEGNKT